MENREIAAISFQLLGLILFLIGFVTPYWSVHTSGHFGLWRICSKDICKNTGLLENNVSDAHKATQTLETFAMIFFLIAFVVLILFLCFGAFYSHNAWGAIMSCLFTGVLLAFIGLIIHYADSNAKIGWSLISLIGGILGSFITAVMITL